MVEPLTDEDYFVRGSTALLDAVGSTVKKMIEKIRRRDGSSYSWGQIWMQLKKMNCR